MLDQLHFHHGLNLFNKNTSDISLLLSSMTIAIWLSKCHRVWQRKENAWKVQDCYGHWGIKILYMLSYNSTLLYKKMFLTGQNSFLFHVLVSNESPSCYNAQSQNNHCKFIEWGGAPIFNGRKTSFLGHLLLKPCFFFCSKYCLQNIKNNENKKLSATYNCKL